MDATSVVDAARRRPRQPPQLDVVVRVRPLLPHEQQQQPVAVLITPGTEQNPSTMTVRAPEADPIDYNFHKCYDEGATQRSLFQQEVSPAVDRVFAGISSTVVAYGAAGAGKTFTMEGNDQSVGIVPRCIRRLFRVAEVLHYVCEVTASYVEINGGEVRDLLVSGDARKADVPVRQFKRLEAVQGLTKISVRDAQELKQVYESGQAARRSYAMNPSEKLSRGHSILMVQVLTKDNAGGETRRGYLHLVDLAGVGSNQQPGNGVLRSVNGGVVDGNMVVLDEVILKLTASKSSHKRKLAQVLRDGCSHVIVICHVSPSAQAHQVTLRTLSYAQEVQSFSKSAKEGSSTPDTRIHVLDLAMNLLEKSPLTPAPTVSEMENARVKRPFRPSEREEMICKVRKVAKGRRRIIASPPAKVSATDAVDESRDNVELPMEKKLRLWKQAKQKMGQCKSSSSGDSRHTAGGDAARAGGIKRKVPTASTKSSTVKNPRLTQGSGKKATAPYRGPPPHSTFSKQVHTSAGNAENPIEINDEDLPGRPSQAPPNPPLLAKKSSTDPALDKENQLARVLASDKENQPVPGYQNGSAPLLTVEKQPEALAKDLIRAAISFERRHRIVTAYCIFKRAWQLLPKKSAKLSERLACLEREWPAAADQVPSQEMDTSAYMVCVLELDLMKVLNHGLVNELTELHAIGGKRANLVLDARPYQQLEDLLRVPGISANVIARLHHHHTNWANHK